jgi:hypothetical protein
MIRIRVEYDAYNREFKLLDREFGPMLNDGAVYELSVPLDIVGMENDGVLVCIDSNRVARA